MSSVNGVHDVLVTIEALLRANLTAYLAIAEAAAKTLVEAAGQVWVDLNLAAPRSLTGYSWDVSVLPQDISNGIQLYVDDEEDETGYISKNGPAEQKHNILVRYYFHSRLAERGRRKVLLARVVSKILREQWQAYTVSVGNPACITSLHASVDYTGQPITVSDKPVPGALGQGSTSGSLIDTADVLVTVEQTVENIIA